MKRKRLWCSLFLMAFMAAFAGPGHSATFTNGSFEAAPGGWTGSYRTLDSGSTDIPGWTVSFGSIDWINTYWQHDDGSYSIDLSGNAMGQISQTFDTIQHQQYKVTFAMAGNPTGGPVIKDMLQVTLGSQYSGFFEFDTSGKTTNNMGWQDHFFYFTALDNAATLQFMSLVGNGFGPAIDNVRLEAVPIPAAALLLGTGLIGLVAIRRPKKA